MMNVMLSGFCSSALGELLGKATAKKAPSATSATPNFLITDFLPFRPLRSWNAGFFTCAVGIDAPDLPRQISQTSTFLSINVKFGPWGRMTGFRDADPPQESQARNRVPCRKCPGAGIGVLLDGGVAAIA